VSGTTWISGIYGVTTQSGTALPVYVSNTGQLGTAASSERFKKDIKPMEQHSQAILQLKPVTFHYKTDAEAVPQFGLIAEEVAQVDPDLVVRDAQGEIYSVRYEAVNAMLLNEFLKEHRTVQELKSTAAKQEATIAQQQKEIQAITASLKEQASQIQKVSTQLEMGKAAPHVVVNDQLK
jgi:predicted ribosome quality control (RQC) complex YloA/Tae2 family protein